MDTRLAHSLRALQVALGLTATLAGEFAVGLTILAIAPRIGAYVASLWLVLVAVNLMIGGHFDIAVRDIVMSLAAFSVARFVEARSTSPVANAPRPATGRIVTA